MKDYAEIVVVIDESGSMYGLVDDAIGGFNAFLEEQKKLPWEANLTVVKFNTVYSVVYEGPLRDAPPLSRDTYIPTGNTALCDAICSTVGRLGERLMRLADEDKPSRVIFGILTDGQENSSREFDMRMTKQIVEARQEDDGWKFVFLASNQDAVLAAESVGVNRDMAFAYGAGGQAMRGAYSTLSQVVSGFRGMEDESQP